MSTSYFILIIVALTAFFINIPLGYLRENFCKFSPAWFFWIHASIPLIIYLRVRLGVSLGVAPLFILFAVLGQMIGGYGRRRWINLNDLERLGQIPEILVPKSSPVKASDVAIVLMNMGGPRMNEDVPDFQERLFSDPLLIRFPMSWALQKPFAKTLTFLRSGSAKRRYQQIGGGSPIYDSTQAQTQSLQNELIRRGCPVDVLFAFNYSPPFSEEVIAQVKANGKKYILPVSLYPHNCAATTGSSFRSLTKAIQKIYPTVTILRGPGYHLHGGYIRSLADRVREALAPKDRLEDFYVLFSAHGLPLYFLTRGDVYPFEVAQTIGALVRVLGGSFKWSTSYQSAVGPIRWMKPSTEDMIEALARRGIRKILIIPISFVSDHIETLCEIDIEYRALAEKCGIKDFRMSRAVECHPGFISALADTVAAGLVGGHVASKS